MNYFVIQSNKRDCNIDLKNNALLIKGGIPGFPGTIIKMRPAIKKKI